MYPQMIEMISLDKKEELGRLIVKIINIFCVLMFPITLACVLFRTELVSAVFQRGAFDASSTALTVVDPVSTPKYEIIILICLNFFYCCNVYLYVFYHKYFFIQVF